VFVCARVKDRQRQGGIGRHILLGALRLYKITPMQYDKHEGMGRESAKARGIFLTVEVVMDWWHAIRSAVRMIRASLGGRAMDGSKEHVCPTRLRKARV